MSPQRTRSAQRLQRRNAAELFQNLLIHLSQRSLQPRRCKIFDLLSRYKKRWCTSMTRYTNK